MRITWLSIEASFSHASLALPTLERACSTTIDAAWSVVRGTVTDAPDVLAREVLDQSPDVVLATAYLFTVQPLVRVLERATALRPDLQVLMGGPEFLGLNRSRLEQWPWLTAVVRGDGEPALPYWLDVHRDRREWQAVPGLCWIDAGGEYRDNGRAVLRAPLPPPAHESPLFAWDQPFVQVETQRGCPHRCSFCTSAEAPLVTLLNVDQVRAVLDTCRDKGVREVRILDRTFNADHRRCTELLRLFRTEFADLHLHLEWFPQPLTEDVHRELQAMAPGHLTLDVGFQSSSPASLRSVERRAETERAWHGLQQLCALPATRVHADLLAGMPHAELETLVQDVGRMLVIQADEVQLERLKVLPGTPLHRHAAALGVVFAPSPPYEVLRSPGMDTTDLESAAYVARFLDRYANHPALHRAVLAACREEGSFLESFTIWARERAFLDAPRSLVSRFEHLYDYARENGRRETAELVQREWMRQGLSPSHGICQAEADRFPLPGDAVCLYREEPENGAEPKGRAWRLEQAEATYWYVYGRRDAGKKAIAEYRRGTRGD